MNAPDSMIASGRPGMAAESSEWPSRGYPTAHRRPLRNFRLPIFIFALVLLAAPALAESYKVAEVKVDIPGVDDVVEVHRSQMGGHIYIVTHNDGRVEDLTPTEFTALLEREARTRVWWHKLFNITSAFGIVWIAVGLGGQLLFTGRMLVQWLISEKRQRSVVPPIFWWMSLLGASMLLVYFIWRRDIIGVLGQGTGWFIYIRNLYFIYGSHSRIDFTADPAPEPELDGTRG